MKPIHEYSREQEERRALLKRTQKKYDKIYHSKRIKDLYLSLAFGGLMACAGYISGVQYALNKVPTSIDGRITGAEQRMQETIDTRIDKGMRNMEKGVNRFIKKYNQGLVDLNDDGKKER